MTDLFQRPNLDLLDQAALIVLEGEPRGKGRPRFSTHGGFVKVYTDAETAAYEELIQIEVLRLIGGQSLIDRTRQIKRRSFIEAYKDFGGQPLFSGPVRVEMEIFHPIRASWTKAKKAAALKGLIAPTTKPDIDNIFKVFFDAFNFCMWQDDTQVMEVHGKAFYAEDPSVLVRVIPLDILPA
jgi:Holliday junction resolvase RusA-like endonuclease